MLIKDIFKAMAVGNELSNPTAWKKGQILTTAVGSLVVIILRYAVPDTTFTSEFIQTATDSICGVLVLINLVITKASTKKV